MNAETTGNVRAFVQTAEQAGAFVWVISVVDFDAQMLKRAFVSEETFGTAAAARDAGEARLTGMRQDH
ncbi:MULTISPECIES: hypothetical protein [unclassified Burkholderia]